MCTKHVRYIRPLLRTLQTGIKKTNPLVENLSKLLRKSLGSFMRVSTEVFLYVLNKDKLEKLSVCVFLPMWLSVYMRIFKL